MSKQILTLTVNGEPKEVLVQPYQTLLEVLREEIGMTGAKEGCSTGDCGCCTVLVDGQPVTSCLVVALQAEGKSVQTVEGLGDGESLDPVQDAFVRHGALQCGFCIPGAVVMARALLDENPHPTEEEIRWAMAGNLCRCTGYTKWIEAIQEVAEHARLPRFGSPDRRDETQSTEGRHERNDRHWPAARAGRGSG